MNTDCSSRNDRGLGKTLKSLLPESVFSALRVVFNKVMKYTPYRIKYGIGTRLRRSKYPYKVIRNGDIVVQVGAPKDILLAGRSRAVNFMRLVGDGKTVVVEPDQINCDALKAFAEKNGIRDKLVLCQKGAWSSQGKLRFLSNPDHPATNILQVVHDDRGETTEDEYSGTEVPVDTLDSILSAANLPPPRLISITANGAEPEILKGLSDTLAANVPYVSLAVTGKGYEEMMSELDYDLVAYDDRGFTFERRGKVADADAEPASRR